MSIKGADACALFARAGYGRYREGGRVEGAAASNGSGVSFDDQSQILPVEVYTVEGTVHAYNHARIFEGLRDNSRLSVYYRIYRIVFGNIN